MIDKIKLGFLIFLYIKFGKEYRDLPEGFNIESWTCDKLL